MQRTQLLKLKTLDWDEKVARNVCDSSRGVAAVRSSSEVYGEASLTTITGFPSAGFLATSKQALVDRQCFRPGEVKNTYGRAAFC